MLAPLPFPRALQVARPVIQDGIAPPNQSLEEVFMNTKMSFSGKLSRLRQRLREPEWRRYGMLILTGKLAAIGLLLIAAIFLNPDLMGFRVFAADPALK